MGLKSYKVNAKDEESSILVRRRRNLKISDLERRVRYQSNARKPKVHPKSILKSVNSVLKRLNESTNKQSQRMPGSKDTNRWLFGGGI